MKKNEDNVPSDIQDFKFQINPEIEPQEKRYSPCDVDDFDLEGQERLRSKRYTQDTKERKRLSNWVVWTVSLWLFFTALVLSFNALLNLKISDTVCCMLLGTTTANILGLAYIVLKGLFPCENQFEK